MTDVADHPFRDNKAKPAQALTNSPLHAPCRRCYTDCSPPERLNTKTGIATFKCQCGATFVVSRNETRRHTTWLFTRGRANVQASTTNEGRYG